MSSAPDLPEGFVRWIYPQRKACPKCSFRHARSVRSRRGRKEYRTCKRCGERYIVLPAAMEIDQGGGASQIRPV
jgi:hypothetical protein